MEEKKIMERYTQSCLMFSYASESWGAVDPYKFYTSDRADYWRETCDNAHGGLDVSWAFHKTSEYIKENAPAHLLREVLELVRLAADDEWSPEQIYKLIENIKNV